MSQAAITVSMPCLLLLLALGLVERTESLVLQPSDRKVIKQAGEDSSWFVSCTAGEAEAGDLEWQHRTTTGNLLSISSLAQDRVHTEAGHHGGLDLVFRSVEQGDQGEYICRAKNQPTNTANFDLVIVQSISFGETPVIQMVKLKEAQHRITCGVSGLPFPTVTWRAAGQNIRNNPEVSSVGSKYEVDGTDLIIRNLQKEDEGSYLCKAVQNVVDEAGNIKYSDFKDFVIQLKIEQSPEWLDDQVQGQFYGFVTGVANMTCQAEAEPPPTFSWLDAENNPVEAGTVINDQYKSVLMIPVEHHAVFGAYTCVAENIHGKLEKVVMLTEGAKPGTPFIKPIKIYPDGFDLFIEEPQAEMFLRIEGFQVEIKEINQTWERPASIKNFKIESSSTYNLEGLEPNTHYHVRSRSRNKAGLSDASNIIYLHTHSLNAYPRLGSMSGSETVAGVRTVMTILLTVTLLR